MNNILENKFINKHIWAFLIILSSVLSIFLCLFRMYNTQTIIYGFLIWNLFLAWIPFIISNTLLTTEAKFNSKFYNYFLFIVWLLFLPNCPYIITDIIHLIDIRFHMPVWYDLMLTTSFAFSGMFAGIISLYQIHLFLNKKIARNKAWLIILFSIFLSSFGVYLGRYQRWNSWDLFTKPLTLFTGIFESMFYPLAAYTSFGVTILFSLFTIISYLIFIILVNQKNNDLN